MCLCIGWKIEAGNVDDFFDFLPMEFSVNDFLDAEDPNRDRFDIGEIQDMKDCSDCLYEAMIYSVSYGSEFWEDYEGNLYFGEGFTSSGGFNQAAFLSRLEKSFHYASECYRDLFGAEPRTEPQAFFFEEDY